MIDNKIIAQRPLHFFEKMYTQIIPCFINLAIDVDDPSQINNIINSIVHVSPPFYIKADKENLYRFEKPNIKIHKIPENISKIEDSMTWAIKNCPADGSNNVATIAASSHKIVFSYCHSFFSGRMLFNAMSELIKPTNYHIPIFPNTLADTHDIHGVEPITSHYQHPCFCHYKNIRVKHPDPNDYLQLANASFDINSLNCVQNGKVKGLTEYLAACYIVALKSFGEIPGDGWGIQTAYDVLRSLPNNINPLGFPNHVGNMVLGVSHKPSTVGELMERLRHELNDEIKHQKWLNHMKWTLNDVPEERPRIGLCAYISNVGQVKIRRPVRDIMMRVSQEDPPNVINMLTYSVISEDKNIVKTHLSYGSEEISKSEVDMVNDSVKFSLTHIHPNDSIDYAINLIKDFRKSQKH